MIRAAICDDDPLFMDMVKAKTYDYFMTAGQELDLYCYSSGKPLILAEKEYHLYLLDIVLPEFSGLELADLIRKRNPGCTIIFISSMHNAVYDSIRYAPLRFIRKENLDTELPEALEAFYQKYRKTSDSFIVSFKEKDRELLLPVSQILYIDSVGHYLEVHSLDVRQGDGSLSHFCLIGSLSRQRTVPLSRRRLRLLYQLKHTAMITRSQLAVSRTLIPMTIRLTDFTPSGVLSEMHFKTDNSSSFLKRYSSDMDRNKPSRKEAPVP